MLYIRNFIEESLPSAIDEKTVSDVFTAEI